MTDVRYPSGPSRKRISESSLQDGIVRVPEASKPAAQEPIPSAWLDLVAEIERQRADFKSETR